MAAGWRAARQVANISFDTLSISRLEWKIETRYRIEVNQADPINNSVRLCARARHHAARDREIIRGYPGKIIDRVKLVSAVIHKLPLFDARLSVCRRPLHAWET